VRSPVESMIGGDDVDMTEGEEGASSEEDAAKDLLAAIKRNDPTAVSLALKRHYEACKASDTEPDGDEPEEY